MQSRMHEEFGSHRRLRDQRGDELSREPHLIPRHHDILDRSLKRPLSPGIGSFHRDRRSCSMERRDYGWGRNEIGRLRSRSRSPRFGQVHERLNCGDTPSSRDEIRRKYEFCNYMDKLDDVDVNKNSRFSGNIGKDIAGDRVLVDGLKHDYSGHKSMVREDGTGQVRHELSGDLRPTSNYHEHSRNLGSSSMNVDLGRFKDGGVKYADSVLLDKISAMERDENPELSLRDGSHFMDSTFMSRDFSGRSQFKKFGSMSAGLSGSFLDSHKDGMSFPTDIYPGSSTKAMEPFSLNEYGQRRTSETRRAPEPGHKDLIGYQRVTFSADRADGQDDLYARPRLREGEFCDYAFEELNRERLPYERDSYDPRDMLTRNMKEPIQEHIDDPEHSLRNIDRSLQDLSSLQNHFSSESLNTSRLPYTSKHGGRYLHSGSPWVDLERDATREPEMSSLGLSCDNDISHTRLKYDFESVAGSLDIRERMRNSSDHQHNTERQQLSSGKLGMGFDHSDTYDPLDQSLKKYDIDEEIRRHDFRSTVPSEWNWNNLARTHDLTDRDKRYNEYADDLLFSNTLEYETGRCSRAGKRTFGAETGRVSAPEDWLTPYDSAEDVEEYSTEQLKSGRKKPKGRVGPGLLNLYGSQRSDKKHYLLKNVWVRGRDDVKVDMHANDVEETEYLLGSAKSEPPENSEEFKQLVHRFFLSFTKKINENPSARKRYKEQGRAGSLFCIVCRRSQSKEFIDTRSLLAHCYMSQKFGLRAQHLGLHRAICVLMEWDTKTSSNAPAEVSSSEASAQKDDLILWPPVVIIHNISMFRNISAGKEVINIEALEDFLRGKGFSGGRMKVCLGNPGNTIIMVVKFLGTLTGLQDAHKLKKYFAENKRGRADFEKLASAEGKRSNNHEARTREGKLNELVLYGYMGIAEDLDKVDSDTKRKCSVRSYKEIQDIANDPVKVDQS
ncbi:XS domain-containing protein [Abeliophyllum distichum]|uniref:XS domain-containing protein n=1 Tax=Abeliophyllum distichum TaxID=126358 RepID=A0ABD1UML0_9LAMI